MPQKVLFVYKSHYAKALLKREQERYIPILSWLTLWCGDKLFRLRSSVCCEIWRRQDAGENFISNFILKIAQNG